MDPPPPKKAIDEVARSLDNYKGRHTDAAGAIAAMETKLRQRPAWIAQHLQDELSAMKPTVAPTTWKTLFALLTYQYKTGPYNRIAVRYGFDVRTNTSQPHPSLYQLGALRFTKLELWNTLRTVPAQRRHDVIERLTQDPSNKITPLMATHLRQLNGWVKLQLFQIADVPEVGMLLQRGLRKQFHHDGWYDRSTLLSALRQFQAVYITIVRDIVCPALGLQAPESSITASEAASSFASNVLLPGSQPSQLGVDWDDQSAVDFLGADDGSVTDDDDSFSVPSLQDDSD